MNQIFYEQLLANRDEILGVFNVSRNMFVAYISKTSPDFLINVPKLEFTSFEVANSLSILYTIVKISHSPTFELTEFEFLITLTHFMFKYMYGLSDEDISKVTNVDTSTVKTNFVETKSDNNVVSGFTFTYNDVDIHGDFGSKVNFDKIKEKDFNKLITKLNPEFSYYDSNENAGYVILQDGRNIFEEDLTDTVFNTKNLAQHTVKVQEKDNK